MNHENSKNYTKYYKSKHIFVFVLVGRLVGWMDGWMDGCLVGSLVGWWCWAGVGCRCQLLALFVDVTVLCLLMLFVMNMRFNEDLIGVPNSLTPLCVDLPTCIFIYWCSFSACAATAAVTLPLTEKRKGSDDGCVCNAINTQTINSLILFLMLVDCTARACTRQFIPASFKSHCKGYFNSSAGEKWITHSLRVSNQICVWIECNEKNHTPNEQEVKGSDFW